ncbi:MAG: BMP family ABC transporter substrate-binding protein, partial [Clostridiales bacterium]
MNKKFLVVMMIAVLSVFMLCACAKDDKTGDQGQNQDVAAMPAIAKEDIKVGFVYVGPIGDEGYTFAHNQGRLKLEKELGVKTMYKESVAENADCEKAIRDLIDQGCNVIYATSFGFMDWTANVA